jgi:hypothetical protein
MLDADSLAIVDPFILFDLDLYQSTGSLFWPDACNFYSVRHEAWDLFGLPRSPHYPIFHPNKAPPLVNRECHPDAPLEIEANLIVMNKQRAWRGLMLTLFINRFHEVFNNFGLFWSDKQVGLCFDT